MVRCACTMLLAVVFVAAAPAAFGTITGIAASSMILLALAAHVWAGKSRWPRSFHLMAAVLWAAALVCLLEPAVIAARDTARCVQCGNNLKQIGLALRNYWDAHGCYPPTSTYDEKGRPLHSWRLLIKPYLDSTADYALCDYHQPWDAPDNKRVRDKPQYVYRCPAGEAASAPDPTMTSYLAVVGRKASWRRPSTGNAEDHGIREPAPSSFLVIELANSGVPWMEPKDLQFDEVQALRSVLANSPHRRSNGYFFHATPAVNAVLVEGDMVFMFPWDSTAGVLTGILPPDEPPPPTPPERRLKYAPLFYQERLQPDWPHRIGLPAWIAALGLLFFQVRRRPPDSPA